jgi:hypothetical protein
LKKYFDEKIKEFHEHNLGQITMDDYPKRFMEFLRYVPYLKDEEERVHNFISIFS